MTAIKVGDIAKIQGFFRSEAGLAADPTAVALTVTQPDGTTTTPTPVKAAVGEYVVDYTPTKPGVYTYRWVGTGAIIAATNGNFVVG